MGDFAAIGIALVLLIGNAFFVGAEFSLISARRTQVEPLAAGGSGAARITLRAMDEVSLTMACAQLGITVCSLGLGAVGEPAADRQSTRLNSSHVAVSYAVLRLKHTHQHRSRSEGP